MHASSSVPVRVSSAQDVLGLAGRDLGPSAWFELGQGRVDAFARAVDDWHWAHNDPDLAGRGPFGGPIVHAHLTLSLTVHLFGTLLVSEHGTAMFHGYDRVRFPTAVPVGSRIRLHARVVQVDDLGGAEQLTVDNRVEIEGEGRPGCVGTARWRHYPIGAPERPGE